MQKREIINRLSSIDRDNEDEMMKLITDIRNVIQRVIKDIIQIWIEDEEDLMEEALFLINELRSFCIITLLEAGPFPMGIQRAKRISMIVNAQIENQEKIIKHLVSLLEDREKIPEEMSSAANLEGTPPLKRVCDEAYINLRRLLNTNESEESYLINENIYLHLDFNERDEEITKTKASGKWNRWFDESVEE